MGLTVRRVVAHLLRLVARRRRLLACWLLLLPLLSVALLPANRGEAWLPQLPSGCGPPPPERRTDLDAEQLWPQLQAEVSAPNS